MSERKFFFAALDEEALETWTIYLEFAKAKAVYDEFVINFGKVQFPITTQLEEYDPIIRFDVTLKRKKPLNLQSLSDPKNKSKNNNLVSRNSRASNFTLTHR